MCLKTGVILATMCFFATAQGEEGNDAPENSETQKSHRFIKAELAVTPLVLDSPSMEQTIGTAFFISESGLMMTTGHSIQRNEAGEIRPLFVLVNSETNGAVFRPVQVVKVFGDGKEGRDLALLQIERKSPEEKFPYLELGEPVLTNEEIVVVGYPLVFDRVYRWPLFRWGRVASDRYHLRESKVYVLDMTSAPGFSGSPILRTDNGKVVAILKGRVVGNEKANFSTATELTEADFLGTTETNY